jgi:Family of unknown function (DUF5819)
MKKMIAIFTSIIFGHHLLCTILYNAPNNPLSYSYQKYVANYMEPLFTQRWLLFAPEPATSDLKLWYRVKYNQHWGTWLDPLEPILRKHQKMRFTYNAKLLYVYGNIARDLNIKNVSLISDFNCKVTDINCIRKKEDFLVNSIEFNAAKKYVMQDITKTGYTAQIDSLQIMIIQLYPKQFSERLTNKPFGYANSTEFNPVAY